jgi:hypothetical protein
MMAIKGVDRVESLYAWRVMLMTIIMMIVGQLLSAGILSGIYIACYSVMQSIFTLSSSPLLLTQPS